MDRKDEAASSFLSFGSFGSFVSFFSFVVHLVFPGSEAYKAGMPRPRFLHILVGCLLIVTVAFSFWGTINKPDCQDMDFGSYYRAAVAVSRGQTPYVVDEYGP